MSLLQHRYVVASACLGFALAGTAAFRISAAAPQGQVREFTVVGDRFAFAPARIEVQKDDLVKISFTASDMAHSFTIDGYRIAKRAGAGQTVPIEFRADRAGTFPIYCNLAQDERCKQMRAELVVR